MKKMINRFFSGLKRVLGLQETISVVYVAIMLLPNLFLAITEPLFVEYRAGVDPAAGYVLFVGVGIAAPSGRRDAVHAAADDPRRVPDRTVVSVRRVDHRGGYVHEPVYDQCVRGRRVVGEHLAGGRVRLRDLYSAVGVGGCALWLSNGGSAGFFRRRALWAAAASFVLGGIFVLVSTFAHPGFGVKYHVFRST